MIYTVEEIEIMIFKSKSTIKSRIISLGIKHTKKKNSAKYYYNEYQIELIKENKREYYEENLKKGLIVIF